VGRPRGGSILVHGYLPSTRGLREIAWAEFGGGFLRGTERAARP
jgi:hypothetical protein